MPIIAIRAKTARMGQNLAEPILLQTSTIYMSTYRPPELRKNFVGFFFSDTLLKITALKVKDIGKVNTTYSAAFRLIGPWYQECFSRELTGVT